MTSVVIQNSIFSTALMNNFESDRVNGKDCLFVCLFFNSLLSLTIWSSPTATVTVKCYPGVGFIWPQKSSILHIAKRLQSLETYTTSSSSHLHQVLNALFSRLSFYLFFWFFFFFSSPTFLISTWSAYHFVINMFILSFYTDAKKISN